MGREHDFIYSSRLVTPRHYSVEEYEEMRHSLEQKQKHNHQLHMALIKELPPEFSSNFLQQAHAHSQTHSSKVGRMVSRPGSSMLTSSSCGTVVSTAASSTASLVRSSPTQAAEATWTVPSNQITSQVQAIIAAPANRSAVLTASTTASSTATPTSPAYGPTPQATPRGYKSTDLPSAVGSRRQSASSFSVASAQSYQDLRGSLSSRHPKDSSRSISPSGSMSSVDVAIRCRTRSSLYEDTQSSSLKRTERRAISAGPRPRPLRREDAGTSSSSGLSVRVDMAAGRQMTPRSTNQAVRQSQDPVARSVSPLKRSTSSSVDSALRSTLLAPTASFKSKLVEKRTNSNGPPTRPISRGRRDVHPGKEAVKATTVRAAAAPSVKPSATVAHTVRPPVEEPLNISEELSPNFNSGRKAPAPAPLALLPAVALISKLAEEVRPVAQVVHSGGLCFSAPLVIARPLDESEQWGTGSVPTPLCDVVPNAPPPSPGGAAFEGVDFNDCTLEVSEDADESGAVEWEDAQVAFDSNTDDEVHAEFSDRLGPLQCIDDPHGVEASWGRCSSVLSPIRETSENCFTTFQARDICAMPELGHAVAYGGHAFCSKLDAKPLVAEVQLTGREKYRQLRSNFLA